MLLFFKFALLLNKKWYSSILINFCFFRRRYMYYASWHCEPAKACDWNFLLKKSTRVVQQKPLVSRNNTRRVIRNYNKINCKPVGKFRAAHRDIPLPLNTSVGSNSRKKCHLKMWILCFKYSLQDKCFFGYRLRWDLNRFAVLVVFSGWQSFIVHSEVFYLHRNLF